MYVQKVVKESTAKLSVNAHGSFASFSPFSHDHSAAIPKNIQRLSTSSLNTSVDTLISALSMGSNRQSSLYVPDFPTVMTMGKHVRDGNNNNQDNTTQSTIDFPSLFDDESVQGEKPYHVINKATSSHYNEQMMMTENDNVEIKLLHAEILKDARRLGPPKDLVHLKIYDEIGGANFICEMRGTMKQLVILWCAVQIVPKYCGLSLFNSNVQQSQRDATFGLFS